MKSRLYFFIKIILIVPISAVVLTLFLTLCYCVPLDQDNFQFSIDELNAQGWYSDILEFRPGYAEKFNDDSPAIWNVNNDMMDYLRAGGYSDQSPLYNAMAMGYDGGETYARYWHGYAGILRLLLVLFDCNEIKFLSFVFQFVLVSLVFKNIYNRRGIILSLLFLTQYILFMPIIVSMSVLFAFGMDVVLLGVLFISSSKTGKWISSRRDIICIYFCMIGIFTCFIEELVYAALTWGIVCLWSLALCDEAKTPGQNISYTITSGVSWVWGYGGIWVMKWVISSLVIGGNIIEDGLNSVLFRSSSGTDSEIKLHGLDAVLGRLEAVSLNWLYYYYSVFFAILFLWVVYAIYKFIRHGFKLDSRTLAMGLIALAPILWYFVLANHTIGHRFITYRIFNMGIAAVLMILLFSSDESKHVPVKEMIRKLLLIGVSAVLSFVIATNKTEPIENKNVNVIGREALFSELESGVLHTLLVPQGDYISELGIALYPETQDGEYEIRLVEGDEILYSEKIPAQSFIQSSFQMLELGWKVKPRNEYIFEIIPVFADGNCGRFYACDQPVRIAADFGYLSGDSVSCTEQLTYWIKYDRYVSGRKWLFYFLTWLSVFMCLSIIMNNMFGIKPKKHVKN